MMDLNLSMMDLNLSMKGLNNHCKKVKDQKTQTMSLNRKALDQLDNVNQPVNSRFHDGSDFHDVGDCHDDGDYHDDGDDHDDHYHLSQVR